MPGTAPLNIISSLESIRTLLLAWVNYTKVSRTDDLHKEAGARGHALMREIFIQIKQKRNEIKHKNYS